jgi:hypothetical protein
MLKALDPTYDGMIDGAPDVSESIRELSWWIEHLPEHYKFKL